MANTTIAVVLANDPGEGLAPLTRGRTKAAVPFGGEYRVIDFALSNCLHSGLRRVLVLTGSNSYSLHEHLRDGWSVFNPELGEYVTPLHGRHDHDPYQAPTTADQLLENLYLLERSNAERVLVLQGGHIYRMDYAALLAHHARYHLDATIAFVPLNLADGTGHPVLLLDDPRSMNPSAEQIRPFHEATGQRSNAGVVMGVYVFELAAFVDALRRDAMNERSGGDLELDIISSLIRTHRVGGYRFGEQAGRVSQDRYWNALGSLDAYFNANLSMLEPVPPLDLYQDSWPIWSRSERNPPARTVESVTGNEGLFVNSIVSNGTVVKGASVARSVLFPRVRVDDGATVERSILFHGVHVGEGAALRNCIVEKNVAIPAGACIGFDTKLDRKRFTVTSNGVVIVDQSVTAAADGPLDEPQETLGFAAELV